MKLSQRQRQQTSTSLRMKQTLLYTSGCAALLIMGFLIYFNVGTVNTAKAGAGTEAIDSGSFIINMGIVPQTVGNGLVPYGMVFDLVRNYNTEVKWIIEPTKALGGTDFTYKAVNYNGGPFIIPAAAITSTIKTRIAYWQGNGVQGTYTTSIINVPVYATLTAMPTMTIDNSSGKEGIITNYFNNAKIPSSAYTMGLPVVLTTCSDLWINPHGDPTWGTHSYLYNFAIANGSFVFSQCHATSMMEGAKNTVAPFQQLNFLTTNGLKCYSSGKCGAAVTESHGGNPILPYGLNFPSDPMMQFVGNILPALNGGSEDWYIPQSTSAWRPTTRRTITTGDGVSPREGVLMAYGPAYGLANAGWVMYEAGHDFGSSSTADIAAQRCFLNFMIFAASKKSMSMTATPLPATVSGASASPSASITITSGTPPYTINWTSDIPGVSFGSPNSATTTIKLPGSVSSGKRSGSISVNVTDACNRKNFLSRPFNVTAGALPVVLSSFSAAVNTENKVMLSWATLTEKGNDYFTIERSGDGIEFKELTTVKGAGNSNNLLRYSYLDKAPLNGHAYYRLIQTDFNGKSETYKVVSVNVNASNLTGFKVYPNPIGSSFIAEFESNTTQQMEIQVINMQGVVVEKESVIAVEGRNNCRFNMGRRMLPGTYVVRLMNEKEMFATLKVNIDE